jgi:hypothetical protein
LPFGQYAAEATLPSDGTATTKITHVVNNEYIPAGAFLNNQAAYRFTSRVEGAVFPVNDFTVDFWIYPQGAPTSCQLIEGYSANPSFLIRGTGQGFLQGITVTINNYNFSTYGSPVNNYQWNHIAVVRTGTSGRIYVNGVANGDTITETTALNSPFYWWYFGGTSTYFSGYFGWARMVKYARWTSNFTPPTYKQPPLEEADPSQLVFSMNWKNLLDADSKAVTGMLSRSGVVYADHNIVPTGYSYAPTATVLAEMRDKATSLYCTTTSDGVSSPATSTLDLGSSNFTIDFWFCSSASTTSTPMLQRDGGSGSYSWKIVYVTDGSLSFYYSTDGSNWTTVSGTPSASAVNRQWHHVAVVRNGTTLRLFMNGAQVGSDHTISSAIYNPASSVVTRLNNGLATIAYAHVRITIGSALWTGTSFALPIEDDYAMTSYTKWLLRFREDYGRGTDYAPHRIVDEVSSDILSNVGSPVVADTSPFGDVGSRDFTAEGWFHVGSRSGRIVLMGKSEYDGSNYQGWYVYGKETTGQLCAVFKDTTGTITTINSTFNFSSYAWAHIAFEREGTTLRLYAKGKSVGTATISASTYAWPVNQPFCLAGVPYSGCSMYSMYNNSGAFSRAMLTVGKALYKGATFRVPLSFKRKFAETRVMFGEASNPYYNCQSSGASTWYITPTPTVFTTGTSPFTWDVWIKPDAVANGSGTSRLFWHLNNYYLTLNADGTLTFYWPSYGKQVITSTKMRERKWYHIALVRADTSATGIKIFIDGKEAAYSRRDTVTESVDYPSSDVYFLSSSNTVYVKHWRFHTKALWTSDFTPPLTYADYLNYVTDNNTLALKAWIQFENNTVTPAAREAVKTITTTLNCSYSPVYRWMDSAKNQIWIQGSYSNWTITPITSGARFSSDNYIGNTATHLESRHNNFGVCQKAQSTSYLLQTEGYMYFGSSTYLKYVYPDRADFYYFNMDDFTIHFWFKPLGGSTQVLLNQGTDESNFAFRLWYWSSSQLKWHAKNGGTEEHAITTDGTGVNFGDGNWHHVAVVRSGTTTTVYVDGVAKGSETSSTLYRSSTAYLMIGSNDASRTYGYVGYISTLEIGREALWSSGFTPPTERRGFRHRNSILSLVCDNNASSNLTVKNMSLLSQYITATTWSGSTHGLAGGPVYPLKFGTGDFTIDFWMQKSTASSGEILFAYYPSGTSTYYILITTVSGPALKAEVYDGTTRYTTTDTVNFQYASTPTEQHATHVALVRIGTTITLYRNGIVAGTMTVPSNFNISNQHVMRWTTEASYSWQSLFYNLRVFNQALWTAAFTPPVSGTEYRRQYTPECVAWYKTKTSAYNSLQMEWIGSAFLNHYSTQGLEGYSRINVRNLYAPLEQDFTLEAWIYYPSFSTQQYPIVFGATGLQLQCSDGSVQCNIGGNDMYSNETGVCSASKWHHIAVVKYGTQYTLYVDGKIINTTTSRKTLASNFIGANGDLPAIGGSSYLAGRYSSLNHFRDLRLLIGKAIYKSEFLPMFNQTVAPTRKTYY